MPLAPSFAGTDPLIDSLATSEHKRVTTPKKGRVLVVDDEANARSALVELLQDEGYEVESASDGRKALQVMGEFEPEVVLTDLKMPVLDGLELLKRGRGVTPHASFVVMT